MVYVIISGVFVTAYLAVSLAGGRVSGAKAPKMKAMTAVSVRVVTLLLFACVPALCTVSAVTNNARFTDLAISAAYVQACAVTLICLLSLLQRYGAMYFGMQPALNLEEILVPLFLQAVLFLSFYPSTYPVLYYLGPAFYTGYLMFRMWKPARA